MAFEDEEAGGGVGPVQEWIERFDDLAFERERVDLRRVVDGQSGQWRRVEGERAEEDREDGL